MRVGAADTSMLDARIVGTTKIGNAEECAQEEM
jgi:hypothetical protein